MLGSISCDNQVVDMTDWSFSEADAIEDAVNEVKHRKARAIVLSTAMGITKFRSQCRSEDPHISVQGSRTIEVCIS